MKREGEDCIRGGRENGLGGGTEIESQNPSICNPWNQGGESECTKVQLADCGVSADSVYV